MFKVHTCEVPFRRNFSTRKKVFYLPTTYACRGFVGMGPRNYLPRSKAKITSYVNEKNKFAAAGSCGSCHVKAPRGTLSRISLNPSPSIATATHTTPCHHKPLNIRQRFFYRRGSYDPSFHCRLRVAASARPWHNTHAVGLLASVVFAAAHVARDQYLTLG